MNYTYVSECLAEFLKNIGTWDLTRFTGLFSVGIGIILKCPQGTFLKPPSG